MNALETTKTITLTRLARHGVLASIFSEKTGDLEARRSRRELAQALCPGDLPLEVIEGGLDPKDRGAKLDVKLTRGQLQALKTRVADAIKEAPEAQAWELTDLWDVLVEATADEPDEKPEPKREKKK